MHWTDAMAWRTEAKPVFKPKYLDLSGNNKELNAIIEIIALWEYVIKDALYNYSYMYHQLSIPLSNEVKLACQKHKESFALYDKVMRRWLVEPSESAYQYCYDGVKFGDFKKAKTTVTGNRLLLVGKYTKMMQEPKLLNAATVAHLCFRMFATPSIKLIVGVPGCGKTTHIINNHSHGDLVLTSCTEGAQDIRSRMAKETDRDPSSYRDSYRTIDSYLLNSQRQYARVWVDEALMEYPGKIFLVCLYSRCSTLALLGDPNQLGYINRVNGIKLLYDKPSMFFKTTETLLTSYRCPVDVMAIISSKYEGRAYSMSKVLRSLNCKMFTSLKDVPRSEDVKYLVFKQAEKKQMKEAGFDVSTIHEFQGKQAARVVVVRTSRNAQEPLYAPAPHVLVGLSRHTHSLVYYTPVTDLLKRLMQTSITEQELKDHQHEMPVMQNIVTCVCMMLRSWCLICRQQKLQVIISGIYWIFFFIIVKVRLILKH